MGKKIALLALLIWVMGSPPAPSFAQPAQIPARCLHGPSEQPNHRARREQALKIAEDINRAETSGPVVIPGQRRDYRPLDQLPNVPPAPAGFRLRFYTDGPSYAFSLKDTLDPCELAIFSDQDTAIYEATPRAGVHIRPLETR